MMRGIMSFDILICVGGVRSILLLPLVARCPETIDVCTWRMLVFMSCECVRVYGKVCCVAGFVGYIFSF